MFGINLEHLNIFGGKSYKELVGVDLSANHLKLSYIRYSTAHPEVVNLAARTTSGLSDADISKSLNAAFHSLHTKRPVVIVTLPSSLVITKNIEIPSSNPKEIREIINLQAGRHTPYSREEIIVDYIDLGTYKHSYTKILLVIVARSTIKRHAEILDKAGLRLDCVFFSAEGLARAATKLFKLDAENSPVNIIQVDEGSTDFTIVLRNKILFVRSIPIGTQHVLFEKEKYLVRFADEIKKSLEAYQSEDIDRSPTTLILTGATEELKDLENVLNNTLHFPVRNIPYTRNLLVLPDASATLSSEKRVSFLNAIAPLLSFNEMKVNLIPEEVKLRKSFEEKGKELIKTGILVLTTFVLVFSILINKIYFKTVYLRNLKAKYNELDKSAKTLEKDFARVSLARSYTAHRGVPLEALAELYSIAPLDIELNNIRLDDKGRFTVRGTAEAMSTVFAFIESMEKSNYFKEVKTKYTSKRKENSKDVTDFEITSLLDKGMVKP
ncbi:MAG: pilus assembly protein PilM [Candidatus Omnitrophica bacterium]|nr:pilus assembly protein PilM [Candidatus Omnitrophota bacterium]